MTLPLDHADAIFPGTLKRANEARQELLWTLADVDEVLVVSLAVTAGISQDGTVPSPNLRRFRLRATDG